MIMLMKIKPNIIKIGHIFQIIHTEYYNRRFRIWKNKCIIEFNRKPTRNYLHAKDPEAKYQYLINKIEGIGINHFNDAKAFIEYSNDMLNVYKNIGD